ncbi:hypothetical protein PPTG_23231 [Phytophthora nicotianae INRA-310]|uniref:Uncharacterized protein n=1 Tax=Phytophthora nicotianae (strain INRA-310) TaxID=761204 RepID=W2Q3L7_PHYN3|nr:hypothetical protein PPTG_23231 [Phytophthora nicotianae INRA-310]ETN07149.1 hypothetical protein PPTG_23231 [Phytophthora nicotianae INRA-310]
MLAPPPPTTTNEPKVASVAHRHFLPRKDVSDGHCHDSQLLPGPDLMKTRTGVAGMVQEPQFSTRMEGVNTHVLVTGRLGLQPQAIPVVRRSVLAWGAKVLETSEVFSYHLPCRYGSNCYNAPHPGAHVAADRQDRTLAE